MRALHRVAGNRILSDADGTRLVDNEMGRVEKATLTCSDGDRQSVAFWRPIA